MHDTLRCLDCEALLSNMTSIKRGTCDDCETYWKAILNNHKTIKEWREQQ